MDSYISSAEQLVNLGLTSKYEALEELPEFYKAFSALEAKMEGLSDVFTASASVIADTEQKLAEQADFLIVIIAIFALIALTIVIFIVSMSIIRPLR